MTEHPRYFISLAEQIETVKREIMLRKKVYPGRVQRKRMSQRMADFQLAAMEAVLETVKEAYAREQRERSWF